MLNRYTIGLLAGAALLTSASGAYAQVPAPATQKIFANVNIGGQFASRTLNSAVEKTIYDETATLTARQEIGSGLVWDISGGYRVWHDVYAGLQFMRFSNTQSATYTTSIPSNEVTDRPVVTNGTVDDLKRTEAGVAAFVTWVTPLMDKIDVSVSGGLAVINVTQDTVNDFSVTPPSSVPTLTPTEEGGTAVGPYVAVDFMYSLTERYGAGAYVRYAGGKADLPLAGETNVGGLQAGVGIRLRF